MLERINILKCTDEQMRSFGPFVVMCQEVLSDNQSVGWSSYA